MSFVTLSSFNTNSSPQSGDYVVGYINDPGNRGVYETKTTVDSISKYALTKFKTISGNFVPLDAYGNATVNGNLTVSNGGQINGNVFNTLSAGFGITLLNPSGVTKTSISSNLSGYGGINLNTNSSNQVVIDGSYLLSLINTLSSNMAAPATSTYSKILSSGKPQFTVIKNSPGIFYSASIVSLDEQPTGGWSFGFCRIYDTATVPTSSNTPKLILNMVRTGTGVMPSHDNDNINISTGITFLSGISIAYTGLSFTDSSALSAICNVVYS